MKAVAIDFETYLISDESPIPKPVCLSYCTSPTEKGIIAGSDGMEAFLSKVLNEEDTTVIAHNASFEGLVINQYFPHLSERLMHLYETGRFICTKVNEQHIDGTRKKSINRFSLDALVKHYFNTDISESKKNPDAWRLRYNELDNVPLNKWPQEAIDYAISDSVWTLKIYELQKHHITPRITADTEADFYLNYMGRFGMLIDHKRVTTLEQELLDKLIPDYKKLEKLGLVEYNAKKDKYAKKVKVLRELIEANVKNLEYTAKKLSSVSSESIGKYIGELKETNPELANTLETYLNIMKYEKVLTSFVNRLIKAAPYIRTQYNPCVSTGRTSSSGSDAFASVNIQQMPRELKEVTWDVRNCFIPRQGYTICSIDYSGLELASCAHQLNKTFNARELASMSTMAKLINSAHEPVDMHSKLAHRIMSIKEKRTVTYEEFVANKKKPPYAAYRQMAKPINLGFPGGIGYDTMRTLMARDNIHPRLEVLEEARWERTLNWKVRKLRTQGYPVRVRQVAFDKFQLVYDELVQFKWTMFDLYQDLREFLSEKHKEFLTGETKPVQDEFGVWKKEPMYFYSTGGFTKDWCTYTQVCNGYLMQSPSAIGAKAAVVAAIKRFIHRKDVNILAFIHDEIVFEVLTSDEMYTIIEEIAEIMIDEMQLVLPSVKIAVEAETAQYWRKAGGDWTKSFWKNPGDKRLYNV